MNDKTKNAAHDALGALLDQLQVNNPDVLARISLVIDLRKGSRSGPTVTASTLIKAVSRIL